MKPTKLLFMSALFFAMMAIHAAHAAEYVVLTPGQSSAYYSEAFNQTAVYINASMSPNATIVRFDTINAAVLNSVALENPAYIYLVVQAANLSPGFMNSVDNMTRYLDSDPYLDAGWSVITGYDNGSARDLFNRSMDSSWGANYVFVPGNASPQLAAASRISSVLGASYAGGTGATNDSVRTALITGTTDVSDFVYFAGNSTNYISGSVNLYTGDGAACPAADSQGVACTGAIDVKRILFFADVSDAGRVNGTNADTTWLSSYNPAANYSFSLPIAFSRTGNPNPSHAAAYIGPHSTRWVTSENIVKLFVSAISQGKDILSSLRFAKNAILFNGQSESLASNFTGFVESEYSLFGKVQKPAASPASKDYIVALSSRAHEQNQVIYSENVSGILWNVTATVSTTGVGALYTSSGWQASGAVAWYRYVSPVSGKINMSIVAALVGEIKPDNSSTSIVSFSADTVTANITSFNISVNQTDTDYISNESISGATVTRYSNDTGRVYFARIFSPNGTISSGTVATVNMTYMTSGVRINRTGINSTQNISRALHETFDTINPTDAQILNVSLLYVVPYNITASCYMDSGSNCTLFDSGATRYANVTTLSAIPSGRNSKTIHYNTTLDVNTTIGNNYLVYNRGEIIALASNVASTGNSTVLDYYLKVVNSNGTAVWSNSTKDIGLNLTVFSGTYNNTVPQNMSNGTYTIKSYYLSNGTGVYAAYTEMSIQITDYLNISNATFTSNEPNRTSNYYFFVNDSMTATGNVYNVHGIALSGASVNVSLIGTPNSTSTATGALGYYVAPFSWSSDVGSRILQVVASYNNNTGSKNDTIYITRYIGDNLSVTLESAHLSTTEKRYTYSDWEIPKVTVSVKDPSGNNVYMAPVSMTASPSTVFGGDAVTAINGSATKTFDPDQVENYTLSVSAYSPLNITNVVYNNTAATVYIKWIKKYSGHYVTGTTPSSPVVGSSVTFRGNITISSGNESLVGTPSLAYQLKNGGSLVGSSTEAGQALCGSLSWSGKAFSFSCTPQTTGTYDLYLQATLPYDGINIQTNDTYTFTVATNATANSPGSTGTTSTLSSQNRTLCTSNNACSSGDYCNVGVCAPVSCSSGAIVNHACVPNKKINITSYPYVVEAEQDGGWAIANFTVSNNGFVGLTGATFTLYLPSTLAWTKWYSIVSALPQAIGAGEEHIISLNITIPPNTSIEQYPVRAKITTEEGLSDEKTFMLQIAPSSRNRAILKSSIDSLNSTIDEIESDVFRLMKGAPDEERSLAESKLNSIKSLYSEVQDAVSKGKYFDAYAKQKEISGLISDLKVILADRKAKDDAARTRRNVVAGIVLILAAIAGGFYYLWTPPSGGYSSGSGKGYMFNGNRKASIESIRASVLKMVSELRSKLRKPVEPEKKKYDYMKPPSKRW